MPPKNCARLRGFGIGNWARVRHLSRPVKDSIKIVHFFKQIGIHSMQIVAPCNGCLQLSRVMELQEKEAQKDCSIQEFCLERTNS